MDTESDTFEVDAVPAPVPYWEAERTRKPAPWHKAAGGPPPPLKLPEAFSALRGSITSAGVRPEKARETAEALNMTASWATLPGGFAFWGQISNYLLRLAKWAEEGGGEETKPTLDGQTIQGALVESVGAK